MLSYSLFVLEHVSGGDGEMHPGREADVWPSELMCKYMFWRVSPPPPFYFPLHEKKGSVVAAIIIYIIYCILE